MFEKLRQNLKEWGVNWECFLILHDDEEVLARSDKKSVFVLINGLFHQIQCYALCSKEGWGGTHWGEWGHSETLTSMVLICGEEFFTLWLMFASMRYYHCEKKNAMLLPKVSAMYSSHGVKKSFLYWFYVYSIL